MCDPAAQWIGTNAGAPPQTALFSRSFLIPEPCCFTKAEMDFRWTVHDALGDAVSPAGVYLNGVPVAVLSADEKAVAGWPGAAYFRRELESKRLSFRYRGDRE